MKTFSFKDYNNNCNDNKYECTTYQELALTRRFVSNHEVVAVFRRKWRHRRHLETVTSNRKSDSVSECVFTWRTFLPNLIQIRF